MPLGVTVQNRTAPSSRGAPTDITTAIITGKASTGSLTAPTLVRSIGDFAAAYNTRETANQSSYDWLDTFFREGGSQAYFQRYANTGETAANGLSRIPADLGPGLVAAPDDTPSATTYGVLLDHAAANNRFALLDVADNATVAQMVTAGGTIPVSNNSYGCSSGQWVVVPAPAGVIGGAVRHVQGSAVTAALVARAVALGNPNRAPAGRSFPLQYVTGYAVDVAAADRETLLNAGINTFATVYGVMSLYGFQTKIAQSTDTPFWQANCSITRMWMTAQAQSIGEPFMFQTIDGRGRLASALKQKLAGMLLDLYSVDGLYGETAEEAFAVEVGPSVNTEASVANGQLKAVCEARLSLHTKSVGIDLVSVPVTGRVSQQ